MEKINVEKWICSMIEAYPAYKEEGRIPCMYKQALADQGLEYRNGEIVKKQSEIKQEWSEEDEQYLNNAINACLNEYGDISDTAIWLKSLKDRVRPQTKQEWGEEDEAMRNFIIRIMEVEHPNGLFEVGGFYNSFKRNSIPVSMIISWLKSLRPQNTWKPTQMQISALEWQIASTYQGSWQYKATEELLKQLKAL